MKLQNQDIVEAKTALAELMKVRLPMRESIAIAHLDLKLREPLEAFIKVRDSLFEKYEIRRVRNEDGQVQFTSDKEENAKAFTEEFNELLRMEVDFEFDKIKLPETLEVEPSVLLALERFLEV
jgi:hypothetical protein